MHDRWELDCVRKKEISGALGAAKGAFTIRSETA